MTAGTRPDTPPVAPARARGLRPEQIAHVVHEANRAVQLEQADPTIPVAPPWESCGDEMRASAIDGVRAVLAGATPEQSHENWVRFKLEHGWTLGPVKDETRKQHPLLVPYADLPPAQRLKDALFAAIVLTLAGEGVVLSRSDTDRLDRVIVRGGFRSDPDDQELAARIWPDEVDR